MKLDIQTQSLQSVDSHILDMAKMILASFLLILALAYLWSNHKNKPIHKPPKSLPNLQSHQPRIPKKLDRNSQKQTYRFSMDEDYEPIVSRPQNNDSLPEERELISLLRSDESPIYTHVFSIKQAQQNFINLLEQKPQQSLIYLDEHDLRERQERKSKLLDKQMQIVRQQKARHKKQQEALKEKQTKTQNIESKPNPHKQDKKPDIGERVVFAVNKDQPKTTLPQKPLDFGQVTLGLPTQTKKQEAPKTQQLPQTLNVTITAPKVEQKPVQFGQGFLGGVNNQNGSTSLFGANPQNVLGQNLFGQKPAETKKEQTVSPSQPNNTATKAQVLPSQPATQLSQSPSVPVLPQVQQQSQSQKVEPRISSLSKSDFLQKLIDYSSRAKQHCQLKKTKINNFGRSISNLKQIYETAADFINTINLGDSKQMQTLACQIFDFLLNKTIPVWPKQQGWEAFPPRMKNQTMWKISISTYVLKLNIYRVMGHQTLWLIVFGKLLSLLDFTWKRTQPIKRSATAYKELDLVKNNYFSLLKQDDMAPKYFTRLDLITYFLFCMTTFDPELVGQYLCEKAGQDRGTFQQLKKYKYKWSYNYFWILVDAILQNKTKTYFKPVLYMNILSSMYLQIRRNKLNSAEFEEFDHLRKYILKEAIEETAPRVIQANDEIQALADLEVETRDFKFDGEDFLGQLDTFNFYFKEKQMEYRKASDRQGFEEFEKRCSVFNYFKSDAK